MATKLLAQTYWSMKYDEFLLNPFFVRMRYGYMSQHDLYQSQRPFYHAVQHWPHVFLTLASRLKKETDVELLKILLMNITDEIPISASPDSNKESHVTTFQRHLDLLSSGLDTSSIQHTETLPISVSRFNHALDVLCEKDNIQKAFACLGMIEFIYTITSQLIATYMKETLHVSSPHYEVHQVLDVFHANELFRGSDMAGLLNAEDNINSGIRLGFDLIYDIYYGIETLGPHSNPLYFANVYESSAVELSCIRYLQQQAIGKKLDVVCIASGGDTVVELQKCHNNLNIYALDINPAQVEHTLSKLNQEKDAKYGCVGRYEQIFQLAQFYTNRPEILFNLPRLELIFGHDAVGSCKNEKFIEIFTNAIRIAKEKIKTDPSDRLSSLMLYGALKCNADGKNEEEPTKPEQRQLASNVQCKVGELKNWQNVHSLSEDQKADLIVTSNISDWANAGTKDAINRIFGSLQNTLSSHGILLTRTMHGNVSDLLSWAESVGLCSVQLKGVEYYDESNLYTVHTFIHRKIHSQI